PSTMINAIFFTRFHPTHGPVVLHQVPAGSIVSTSSAPSIQPLVSFPSIAPYLIPPQEFCDRLVTIRRGQHRIISYPICIENKRYERNQFIFNFAMVLDAEVDMSGHVSVVKKLARMFRNLEEQSGFLSKEEDYALWDKQGVENGYDHELDGETLHSRDLGPKVGDKVYALCEMILEDLNNYSECMIPIDDSNTINLKLFPTRPPPAPVHPWHVPLATVSLSTLSISSDLTLNRLLPYINGISSVAAIAHDADVNIKLARKAIAHLLYYGCILLLDIFQYGAVYAPTPEMGAFIEDDEAQEEAVRYISVGQYRRVNPSDKSQRSPPQSSHAKASSTSDEGDQDRWEWNPSETGISKIRLIELYTSLKPVDPDSESTYAANNNHSNSSGPDDIPANSNAPSNSPTTLRDWCLEHHALASGIDVRRFITFGIIKGFLYRVHKYAIAGDHAAASDKVNVQAWRERWDAAQAQAHQLHHDQHQHQHQHHPHSHQQHHTSNPITKFATTATKRREGMTRTLSSKDGGLVGSGKGASAVNLPMARFLDGMHCFDEICTELGLSEREAERKIREAWPDVVFVWR
ncbi:nitrogen permease regulator 2, partial [Aulographum hederae CBS 113979]